MRRTLLLSVLLATACARGDVELPPAAEVRGRHLEGVVRSFPAAGDVTTAAVRCVALHLQDPVAIIGDAIGPLAARGGGGVLEAVDHRAGVVVARAGGFYRAGPFSTRSVRFRMVVEETSGGARVSARSPRHAQTNTGTAPNSGWTPVGTWTGGGAPGAFRVMDAAVLRVGRCVAAG